MYLGKIYKYNRFWFTVILLFILCQFFINFKRGMVVSPFYHYGMYSQVMKPEKDYAYFEITVNNKLLQVKDFTAQQWDKIMQPVIYYYKHQQWNDDMFNELQRITGISDSTNYVNDIDQNTFSSWYQNYLAALLGKAVTSVTVHQKTYTPEGSF